MAKRKAIGKKARFEVLKRDNFKCQYCGKSAPDVVLQVDHINPVSKGGTNDPMNLLTSCWDCNSGKSNRRLDDNSVIQKQKAQIDELNERREQLEMMLKWRDGLASVDEMALDAISDRLLERTNFSINENGRSGNRKLLKKFSLSEVLDALDIAIDKYVRWDADGSCEAQSVENALSKVSGIAYLKSQPDGMKHLYYARGILRKRVSYCPDWKAIKLLKMAHEAGADPEELKDIARTVGSWSAFQDALWEGWEVWV